MPISQRIANPHAGSVWQEAKRYGRIQTLALSLVMLRGARKAVMNSLYALLAMMIFVVSFVSLITYLMTTVVRGEVVRFDLFVGLTGSISIFALAIFAWALGEKRWLDAFGFSHRIAALLPQMEAQVGQSEDSSDRRRAS